MLKTVGFPSTRSGNQTIVDGDLVIGTAGRGIDFSADPHPAGMTSELLDDYEEGTWTPTITSSNSDVIVAYSTNSGTYTKIGRLVTITCVIVLSSKSGGTGTTRVGGIPFVASAVSSGAIGFANNYTTGKPDQILTFADGTIIPYYSSSATASAQLPISHVGNTSALYFTMSYIV